MRSEFLYALRLMRKQPGFAVAVIVTLALGIAGNTIMFTLIHVVLLKPLPYRDPDALVRISLDSPRRDLQDYPFSLTRYEEVRVTATSFAGFGAFNLEKFTLSLDEQPEQLLGARVSANFLEILGVRPQLGRGFLGEEDVPGGPPVAMLSDALWRRRFHAQTNVIGKAVTLDFSQYLVVGILPPDFAFPSPGIDIWVTKVSRPSEPMPHAAAGTVPYLTCFARLGPHVSADRARAEMDLLSRRYGLEHPAFLDTDPSTIVRLVRLQDQIVENIRPTLWVLFGAVAFVLLIACANVTSLLLARAISRSREFAVRAALGATRKRLIRQLLVEGLLLALVAGSLGMVLGGWGLKAITHISAIQLARVAEIRLDGSVLLFTLAISLATEFVVGLFPSFQVSRLNLANVLREHGAMPSAFRRQILGMRSQNLLVVGQVAMSAVLLISAALLIKSFARLRSVDLGFQPSNLSTMQVALPPSRYDTDRKKAAFYQDVVLRVESIPGIRGVSVVASLPTGDTVQAPMQVAGHPLLALGERPVGQWQAISTSYFRVLRIQLRRGREFTERDNLDAPWVAIINESMAHRFWPDYPGGQDPVGQHLLFGVNDSISAEIVGIVADVHEASLTADIGPEAYMPLNQRCLQTMNLIVRTDGDPHLFANTVHAEILAVDPYQPVSKVRTMEEVLESSIASQRLTILILALFAGMALLLAAIGIYGVISYSVAQRAQEIGIRRALGAQQDNILMLVIRQSLVLSLLGVLIGLGGALATTRGLSALLFHVSATDPETFAVVAIVFVLVALAASYIPARRATRIDPISVIR